MGRVIKLESVRDRSKAQPFAIEIVQRAELNVGDIADRN